MMGRIRTAVVIRSGSGRSNRNNAEYEEVRPDFCPVCGHEILWDDEEYCPFCGEELGSIVRPKKKETGSGGAGGVIFLFVVIVIAIMLLKRG